MRKLLFVTACLTLFGCATPQPLQFEKVHFGRSLPSLGDALPPLGSTSVPVYQNGQWYVWSNQVVAASALNYINATDWFPQAGHSARTGKDTPFRTTKWEEAVIALTEGRYGFPRIPQRTLDALGVLESDQQAFWAAFQPMILVVTSDMHLDYE